MSTAVPTVITIITVRDMSAVTTMRMADVVMENMVRTAAAGMKNLKRAAAAAAEADVTADSALLWKVKTSAGMSGFTTGEHLMTEHSSTHPMTAESLLHLSAARA